MAKDYDQLLGKGTPTPEQNEGEGLVWQNYRGRNTALKRSNLYG